MLGSVFSSSRSVLSLQETLDLASSYLETARKAKDLKIALVLCDDAEASLSKMKKAVKKAHAPETLADQTLRDKIATVYFEHGKVLEQLGQTDRAQTSYKKAKKWGSEENSSSVLGVSLSARSALAVAQTTTSTSLSAQQKSELVDYLFEKALLTLSSLEVSNKPRLFLVYAHDNPTHGEAKASTSKDLIKQLSKIQVILYSDQAPTAQPYSSVVQEMQEDVRLENILSNQLCLLPTQLKKGVKPVDKVVVCCSEVLGKYLEWPEYKNFYQRLCEAYLEDRKAYLEDDEQASAVAIRQVVREFSQASAYKAGFHHVLTEMAFLEIRAKHWEEDRHGIIPVSLTPKSYQQCLARFITSTTVRMEDMLRFDATGKTEQDGHPNQKNQHGVLFKLIERLLAGNNEAKTFLSKFWDGHGNFMARLKKEPSLGHLEFARLIDSIFDDIRTALHSRLASTVQQHHRQLWVLNADPREALKAQYFAALKQDEVFKETEKLYVEPRGKANLDGKAETFDLLSKIKALLTDKQVVLLTGDSGAGKSTLNRLLEKQLWEKKEEPGAIPLFISLASIGKPEHDLIAKALKKKGLSEFQIQTLKKEKQKFIFILDGYDEIRQMQNLYLSNRINQSDGWQGQMVISCRSEYLGQDYLSRFQPNPNLKGEDQFFQEVVIEPFSETERNCYLKKYVAHNQMGWASQRYQAALEQLSHLKDLVSNPFLLRVVLDALPYLENEGKARSAVQLRLDLYDQFVRLWFERNQRRLSTQNLTGSKGVIFRELSDDGFARHGLQFVQDLAVHLYTENAGNPVFHYSLFNDKGNWQEAFFGQEDKQQLLRESWPLTRSGNQYRFIHKSLLEYCVARSLFESFDACSVLDTHHRRGSDASVYSFENQSVLPTRTLPDVSLAPKHWSGDLGVVRWLTERVGQEPLFKKKLLVIVERSKTDADVRQVAANAITILIRAGVQFNRADLKGIRIPGADLSEGVFDHAQLQGADLRKVILRKIWLRQANLDGAKMASVQFGEWPFLQEDSAVITCMYSQDGKLCAVGLHNGTISVYDASSWKKIHTLHGHTGDVWSVVYSPNGQQIASGSADTTVRLWDAQSGKPGHTLSDHSGPVRSVVYSPNGQQIASGSVDTQVRLWDVQSGQLTHTLTGHEDPVWSVVYSPNGQQIASGSADTTVRLWDAQSGNHGYTLTGHKGSVWSVVYSPNGQQIASSSEDTSVRLWDVQSGKFLSSLIGHTRPVIHVAYSPHGRQIASSSTDTTVRLWDPQSGQLSHTLTGHEGKVWSVVY